MRGWILAVAAIAVAIAGGAGAASDQADETAIRNLIDGLTAAWNRADAETYAARYRADGTFTNVNGTLHLGRDEFERRHADIFRGIFNGTTLTLTPRNVLFIRPDVAIVDLRVALLGLQQPLSGIERGPDGSFLTSLQLVLVKDNDGWWIASYHNVWVAAAH
jgi:uncharacterized protein (TIGR02246 family)